MSITEVILVTSLVVNLFSVIILFLTFIYVLNMKMQMQQMYVGLTTTVTKIFGIEQMLVKLGDGFKEFIRLTENVVDQVVGPNNRALYKTMDGKYTARTVDELIDKIKKDGKSDMYFNDEELDKLKKMFEPEDDFDEDEED